MNHRIEKYRTEGAGFAGLACTDGLPRIWQVVSRETGWPIHTG